MSKKKIVLPLFIVALMVFSIFGVVIGSFSNDQIETFKFNGYRFTYDGTIWFTHINNQRLEFTTDPRQLEGFYIGDIINKISNHNKVYLSVNPEDNIEQEKNIFIAILSGLFNKPIIRACPSDNQLCENLPLKDCSDSIPEKELVIKLEKGDNLIQEDVSCIAILGDRNYFVTVLEKIRLEVLL
ncbi:MAG: hypothetical protein AABX08_02990 [Nanoarchaeota archaeon]